MFDAVQTNLLLIILCIYPVWGSKGNGTKLQWWEGIETVNAPDFHLNNSRKYAQNFSLQEIAVYYRGDSIRENFP